MSRGEEQDRDRLKRLKMEILLLTLKIPREEIRTKDYVEQAQRILDEMKKEL